MLNKDNNNNNNKCTKCKSETGLKRSKRTV